MRRPEPDADRLPATAVLGFLAETLGDLARRVEAVEAHVAGAIDPGDPQHRVRVMALQDLDLIRQTAEDAARIADIARRGDGLQCAELARGLRLSALRERLARLGASGDAVRGAGATEGDGRVELFGPALPGR
jgi:hypothetical protein